MFSQSKAIGMEQRRRKSIERWRVRERSSGRLAPKAWEHNGSMPRARPERTE